ncbi:MAG: recombination protein NinG [Candidatus Pacearchaeota archaeon]
MKLGGNTEKNAVLWCHRYIRLRDLQKDKNGNIFGYCFTCNAKWDVNLFSDKSISNGKKWHAGHFYKADRTESVRFDERNIHLQCYNCNKNLSGNESSYAKKLRELLGDDEFAKLEFDKNQLKKHFAWDYDLIAKEYREKAHQEAERLGIKI